MANYIKLFLLTGFVSVLNPVSFICWIVYSITQNYLGLIDLYEYETGSLIYAPHYNKYNRVAPRPSWLDDFLTENQRRQATLS